jgi:hypothetical protein
MEDLTRRASSSRRPGILSRVARRRQPAGRLIPFAGRDQSPIASIRTGMGTSGVVLADGMLTGARDATPQATSR